MSSIIDKTISVIRYPSKLWDALLMRLYRYSGNYKALSDVYYRHAFKRKINWEQPEDLNQWISWLSFNTDTTQWTLLADKYKVREFIAARGFEDNLVPILKVWDDPDKISMDGLPEKFVLKANNGSGDVRIITDKQVVDETEIKTYFKTLFSHPFGKDTAEPHYLRIKPLVIAEKLLDTNKQSILSSSLIDYKFWCFNGKPVLCFVCSNRSKESFTTDLYSIPDWKRVDEKYSVHDSHHLKAAAPMPKPSAFNQMQEIASALSKGFPQIRVDFYLTDGRVYIGELTMTSMAGRMNYLNEDCLQMLGKCCENAYNELADVARKK